MNSQRTRTLTHILWPYTLLAVLLVTALFGCQGTTSPTPDTTWFSFPHSLGTTWEYRYIYYYSNFDGAGPYSRSHQAHQTWEVVSVTPYPDSTVALVRAVRIDTMHYKHEIWNPYFPDIDTTFIITDTISFPIVITPQRITARWTRTLFTGPWSALDTLPNPLAGNTYVAKSGPSQAWFSSDSGLTKYTGSLAQKFFWAETLALSRVSRK